MSYISWKHESLTISVHDLTPIANIALAKSYASIDKSYSERTRYDSSTYHAVKIFETYLTYLIYYL